MEGLWLGGVIRALGFGPPDGIQIQGEAPGGKP